MILDPDVNPNPNPDDNLNPCVNLNPNPDINNYLNPNQGYVTGILDDSNMAFQCYSMGAALSVIGHMAYAYYVPQRIIELKAEDTPTWP